MKLADYMARRGLDDEAMAGRVQTKDVKCDRTQMSRYRRGRRRPDWPVIERIARVTKGDVTADDWMTLEAAE